MKPKTGSQTIAEKLKAWRKAHSFSQPDAAEKLGVPVGTLRDWEQARAKPRGLALGMLKQMLEK